MFAAVKTKIINGLKKLGLYRRYSRSPELGDLHKIMGEDEYREYIENNSRDDKPTEGVKDNDSVLSVLSVLNSALFSLQGKNTGSVQQSTNSAVHDTDTSALLSGNNDSEQEENYGAVLSGNGGEIQDENNCLVQCEPRGDIFIQEPS